ncbi:hypothetical protein [Litchfieldella xinjiangensis]|uniref:hypothetical protein n=1 Tax=Litchfieldella xinjiangensis TaxID=1166948 RepID=UPI0012E03DC0|nr:hypothetical protein [Halomonas xinjiangensis]
MRNPAIIAAILGVVVGMSGCSSMATQPYSPVPEGVSISANHAGGYQVDSVTLNRSGLTPSSESLDFCIAQNIPGLSGSPVFNPANTKVTAQGRDQVSFTVPRTLGSRLNYEISFTSTLSKKESSVIFDYTDLKIRGTWSANENPLPATQEAHLYVESALNKFENITNKLEHCLRIES